MNKTVVVFDLDDTLIDTSEVYFRSRSCFLKTMAKCGFSMRESLFLFEEMDGKLMLIEGHNPSRYSQTMKITYKLLTQRHNISPDKAISDAIVNCGNIVTQVVPPLIEGALDLLEWARQHFVLAVYTRGRDDFQRSKLSSRGLKQFFDIIEVVETKTDEQLDEFLKKHDINPTDAWMVGDSIKADINPAIRLGLNCIHFEYQHPEYEWIQESGVPSAGNHFSVDSLDDVKNVLQRELSNRLKP